MISMSYWPQNWLGHMIMISTMNVFHLVYSSEYLCLPGLYTCAYRASEAAIAIA